MPFVSRQRTHRVVLFRAITTYILYSVVSAVCCRTCIHSNAVSAVYCYRNIPTSVQILFKDLFSLKNQSCHLEMLSNKCQLQHKMTWCSQGIAGVIPINLMIKKSKTKPSEWIIGNVWKRKEQKLWMRCKRDGMTSLIRSKSLNYSMCQLPDLDKKPSEKFTTVRKNLSQCMVISKQTKRNSIKRKIVTTILHADSSVRVWG